MKIVKQNLVIQGNDMGRPWETTMSIYRTTSPMKFLDRMGRISKGFWTYSVIHNKLLLDALETEAEKNIIDPITASLANAVPAPLCAHTSMHVDAYACVCGSVYTYVLMEARAQPWRSHPSCFYKSGLSSILGSPIRLGWLASESRDPLASVFSILGLQTVPRHLAFYMGAGKLNSGPHICMASVLFEWALYLGPKSLFI